MRSLLLKLTRRDRHRALRRVRPLTTLELMRLLDSSQSLLVATAEEELRRRRLSETEIARAKRYAMSDEQARVRMAEELLASPPAERRAWLQWLSEDASPAVRIATLEAMYASGDVALHSRIREMAIRERDRSVAQVANRLLQDARTAQQRSRTSE